MPFNPNRQYSSPGPSSYSSPYSSSSSGGAPPLNSLLLGRYDTYNNSLLRSSYNPFVSSTSYGGPYGQSSSYTSPYGSSSSMSSSYSPSYGGPSSSSYKSFSSLAPISEHSAMSSYSPGGSKGGPSRLPRGYNPPSFPVSTSNYSPSSYTSYKNKPQVWNTENIDVTTPRKSKPLSSSSSSASTAATPGDISRDKQFGTIKRGRTVIRITTQKQKDNPYLTDEENKARAEERKKERTEENLLEKLKNELKNELQNKPGKKTAAGDKFREKFMIQSRKKKYAGYRRPTLTDIRDEKDALEGELDEMIASNESPEEIEQVRERLRQLDKRIQRRFSRALKKANNASSTNLNVQDDDDASDNNVGATRKPTVIKKSSSSSQPFPDEEKKLQRKATQKFFFPAEGASAVEPELVEDVVQPEVDLFEQHILANRAMSQRRTSHSHQNVRYIRPRKSSITNELLDMANNGATSNGGVTTPNSEVPMISPAIVKKPRKISSIVAPPVPIPEPPVEEQEVVKETDEESKADVAQKGVETSSPVIEEKNDNVAPWRKKKKNTGETPPTPPAPKQPVFVAPWRKIKQTPAPPVAPPPQPNKVITTPTPPPPPPPKVAEESKKEVKEEPAVPTPAVEVKKSEEKPVVVEQQSKIRAFLGKVKQKFSFEKEDIAEVKLKDEEQQLLATSKETSELTPQTPETKTEQTSKEAAVTPPGEVSPLKLMEPLAKVEAKDKSKPLIQKMFEVPEKPKIPTLAALRKEKLAQQKSFDSPAQEKTAVSVVKQKSLDTPDKKVLPGTPPANRKVLPQQQTAKKIVEESKPPTEVPKTAPPPPPAIKADKLEPPKSAEVKQLEEVTTPTIPSPEKDVAVKAPLETVPLAVSATGSPKTPPPVSPAQLKPQQPVPEPQKKSFVEPLVKKPAGTELGKLGTPPPPSPKEKDGMISKVKTSLVSTPPPSPKELFQQPTETKSGPPEQKKSDDELQKKLPIELVKKPVVVIPKKIQDVPKTDKTLPKDSSGEETQLSSPSLEKSPKPEVPETPQKKIPEPIAVPKQLEQTKKSPPDSPKTVESPKELPKTMKVEIPPTVTAAAIATNIKPLEPTLPLPSSFQKDPVEQKEIPKPADGPVETTPSKPSVPAPLLPIEKAEEPSTSKQVKVTTPPAKPVPLSKSQEQVPTPKKPAPPLKSKSEDEVPPPQQEKQKTPQPQQFAFGFNKQETPSSLKTTTTREKSPKVPEEKPPPVAVAKKEPEILSVATPAVPTTPPPSPGKVEILKETSPVVENPPQAEAAASDTLNIPSDLPPVSPKKKSGSKKKKGSKSRKSQEETPKGSSKKKNKKSSKRSKDEEDKTGDDEEVVEEKPTCLLSRTSTSSSSGSSTATESSSSGTASTSSTLSAGSSGGRRRRLPSPPEDDEDEEEEEEEQVSLDKICPAKNRPKYRKYHVEDFSFLKVLGKGSFGKVLLAELKDSDSYFAIKCLKKDVVLEDDDVECTMIERKVLLMGSKHPYLCHLFCTFQTESHLFFVMEYLNGGDLMFHIQQSGRFSEERGRFYGAEIVSGLKFLHKKGVMYRDLKLDNILLDYEGHIRIADFGMCKLQIYLDRTADTFCGTPDYMAPEIIKGLRYNQCVDWWAFGVLLYEMLVGQSPFSGADEDELFWSICNEPVHFPRFLSKEAKAVLERLLEKDTCRRLGMTTCAYGDIKNQVFFYSIDWDKLERRELEPPFRPKLKHPLDVQYFDTTFTKEIARLTPVDKEILQSMDQSQFEGFSYTNPHTTD